MKSIEQLAQVDTGQIEKIIPEVISGVVETALRKNLVAGTLLRENTDILVPKKGKSVNLLKRKTISARGPILEGASIKGDGWEGVQYDEATVTPGKYGVAISITNEAIEAGMRDVINDNIQEAGIALAEKEDEVLFTEILGRNYVEETITVGSGDQSGSLSNKNVLEVTHGKNKDNSDHDPDGYDYVDGKFHLEAAATASEKVEFHYYWSKKRKSFEVGDVKKFLHKDVIGAEAQLKADKERPNYVVCCADTASKLRGDVTTNLKVPAERGKVSLPGEVGSIGPLTLLVSSEIHPGTAVLIDSRRAGWEVLKRGVKTERDENKEIDAINFYVTKMFAPAITDEGALVVCNNAQADAMDL